MMRPGDSIEVQLHPAASRGRVRYFRLTRTHLTFWSSLGLLYLLLLAAAAGLAPGVVAGWFGSEEYRGLAGERARQGERLLALVSRLEQLRAASEELSMRVRMVAAAYEVPVTAAAAAAPAAAGAPAGAAADRRAAAAPESIYDDAMRRGDRLRARIAGQLGAAEAALAAVGGFEASHPDLVRDMPAACPLRGDRYVLSNPFGRRRGAWNPEPGFHAGIDLAAPRGTPIVAPAAGTVVFAGVYPLARGPAWWRYGNLVAVAHGERYLTLYGHCGEIKVGAGQAVRRGEVLAGVGSSGWSMSPHLHYEVRRRRAGGGEAVPVNPLIYILDRRWPDEERLLAQPLAPARDYEPLPPGLDGTPLRAKSVKGRSPGPPPRRW
ncbi:MAG: M23 family metallopeptidase [Acidobacteria bacterium]|nr:M23 family metallopeptidase [Acidobacteriota bacterium]